MIDTNLRSIQLAPEERSRIGQTIITGFVGVDADEARELLETVRPAGVIVMPRNVRNAAQVRELTDGLQAIAKELDLPPLLVAVDQEGGAVLRLGADHGFTDYPSALALATGGDVRLARDLAAATGRELATVGIDLAFAPVFDLGVDPHNRVIGSRSFGADPETVGSFAGAVVEGLREAGILSCAKHFPGHGATAGDSHLELPVLTSSLAEMRDRDLVPFRAAVEAGCTAIMTAHVISALDPSQPATTSRAALGLLREELIFDGLIITDALEMRAITGVAHPEHRGVAALEAGADLLLFDGDFSLLEATIAEVARALRRGELDPARLEASAERLAAARTARLVADRAPLAMLRSQRAQNLASIAARSGLAVRDPEELLPLLEQPPIVDLDRGRDLSAALGWPMAAVADVGSRAACVVAVSDDEIPDETQVAIRGLMLDGTKVILVVLEGWQLPAIETAVIVLALDLPRSLWLAIAERLVAPKPSVRGSSDRTFGGVIATALVPDLVPKTAPAAQLVVELGGRRVVDVAVGDSSDGGDDPATIDTRFDLASVTKVVTAMAFLRLVEDGTAHLDRPVREVLPVAFGANPTADRVTWRDILSHAAGLPAVVDLRSARSQGDARMRVLAVEPERPTGERVLYSDVGFMLLGFAVEALARVSLDVAIDRLVLRPLGMTRTTYHPEPWVPIAQTGICGWRRRRLRGEVHDENTAALGGVAGHAGLFGTAEDVAELGRCLLDGGTPILSRDTVREMVREQARDGDVRKGLGVSLWSPGSDTTGHPFGQGSFGHTGFTGTSLWVDPDRRLVIALLTNAVARDRDNHRFWAARIALHSAIASATDATSTGRIAIGTDQP